MDAAILDRVQENYPRLKGLVENYRLRREEKVAVAIIDALLSSGNRCFTQDEVIYLSRLKSIADMHLRSAHEHLQIRLKHARRMHRLPPELTDDPKRGRPAGSTRKALSS